MHVHVNTPWVTTRAGFTNVSTTRLSSSSSSFHPAPRTQGRKLRSCNYTLCRFGFLLTTTPLTPASLSNYTRLCELCSVNTHVKHHKQSFQKATHRYISRLLERPRLFPLRNNKHYNKPEQTITFFHPMCLLPRTKGLVRSSRAA